MDAYSQSDLQPFLADGRVLPELGWRALKHDAAVTHYVDAVRYPHRDRELLLDQQDGYAASGDFGDEVADLLRSGARALRLARRS